MRNADRPAPRHPARAEIESTAGLLARGSWPVTAFPGIVPVAPWLKARRLQLRGQPRNWNVLVPHRIPSSLSLTRDRRSRTTRWLGGRFVNAGAPCSANGLGYIRCVVGSRRGGSQQGTRSWRTRSWETGSWETRCRGCPRNCRRRRRSRLATGLQGSGKARGDAEP